MNPWPGTQQNQEYLYHVAPNLGVLGPCPMSNALFTKIRTLASSFVHLCFGWCRFVWKKLRHHGFTYETNRRVIISCFVCKCGFLSQLPQLQGSSDLVKQGDERNVGISITNIFTVFFKLLYLFHLCITRGLKRAYLIWPVILCSWLTSQFTQSQNFYCNLD